MSNIAFEMLSGVGQLNSAAETVLSIFTHFLQDQMLHSSSHLSNGSSELVAVDEPDSQHSSELARQQVVIKNIQSKIEKTKGLIRREQKTRDGNFD